MRGLLGPSSAVSVTMIPRRRFSSTINQSNLSCIVFVRCLQSRSLAQALKSNPPGVLLSVESIKAVRVVIQLVAENNDQMPRPRFEMKIHGRQRITITNWRPCAIARNSARHRQPVLGLSPNFARATGTIEWHWPLRQAHRCGPADAARRRP